MKMSNINKFISGLLGVAMCPMMLPTAAFAADDGAASEVSSSPTELIQSSESEGADTGASSGDTLATQSESASEAANATIGKTANEAATLAAETGEEGNEAAAAEVNGKTYSSLQDAIDAASERATVKLLANTKENVTISTKNVTLDLNGYTLNGSTGERKPALTVTSRVYVKDSSKAQTGTIMREDTKENSGVSSHYVIDVQGGNSGWLFFQSGNVKNDSGAGGTNGASLVRVGDEKQPGLPHMTITGGTFTQDNFIVLKCDSGILSVAGGTINSKNSYAIQNWKTTYIKDGDKGASRPVINGNVSTWTYNGSGSSLEISGGTVAGNVESVTYDGAAGKPAKVAITGGTVNGTLNTVDYSTGTTSNDPTKATIEVSGGTFNKSISEGYCADGFIPTKNADGTYGVKEGHYVAQIGSKKYETLADAIRLAAKGKTITLLTDVEQNTQLTINKNITLDLNGKTIKNTQDIWGDKANAILSITNGAKVTITGDGTIDAKENDCYTINVVKGDLTIENGTFYGNVSVVQVEEGTLSVKGGTFDLHQKWEGSSKYLFNCIDDAYANGSANVAISGGTFVGFDPSASPEGEGTSYLAPGYAPTDNGGGTYGVKLAEGAYLLQDYRSGDQASWTYPTQEGMAFAGWYKDASFTTPCAASDVEGAAYAKFVPITDLLQFKGGSLRMDVTDPSTSTYLRFGYTMAIPEKSAFIENGWYYKKVTVSSPDDVRFVAYNNAMNNDGTVTANLVFNNVKTNLYKANFTEKAFVKYVTADGTTVEAVESDYQTRSVGEVADAILKHPMASNSEKEYALKIKSAIQ